MKKIMTRATLALVLLFSLTSRLYSQLAPSPTLALTNVPEAALYGVMYQIDIPVNGNYTGSNLPVYNINNSTLTVNYNRVAYFMQVDNNWVWVSMNKFNTTNAQLGIPYNNAGIAFQQTVSAMNVVGSPSSNVTSTTGINGNIEIWNDCYTTGTGLAGIGGNGGTYDFNDTRTTSNCYGSFQVHNYGASQTLFAWNSFMNNNNDDLGIGTRGTADPDWTFAYNSGTYTTRKLWILVDNGINITGQPSTLAKNACLNGTVSPLTVTTAAASATLTDYQWYSNTTASNTGGTLVATHTSSLTTDSYTPSTTAGGTLYYYCIANGTGTTSAKSNVSGAVNVENATLTISGTGSICVGDALTLSANSTAAGSTFTWSTSENTSTISVNPGTTTNYTVSGTSPLGCMGVSSAVTVTVNALPVITAADGTICAGGSFVFTPGGAVSYSYSSGSATVSPLISDSYIISGTSAEGCVGSNNMVSVTVHTLPVVSITGTNAICDGASATLTANGAASYTWNTGSNATSISVNPTITTSYSVSGTSSEGCVSTLQASSELTVHALPIVSITGTNQTCEGTSVNLTANGASTYTWSNSANTTVISVTPSVTTGYSVVGTSADGCLSASFASATLTVNALPIVSITSQTNEICIGASAGYTASGAISYTWSTGSNASNISVSPTSTTIYSVSGTSSFGCVSNPQSAISITVHALPTVSISGQSAICAGGSASLIANGASTYTFAGLGSNSAYAVIPSVTTSYTLTGTSVDGCVSIPVVKTITVNSIPVVTISGPNVICAGASTNLTAGGASTYTWLGGLGSSTSIAVSPTATTVYTLNGTSAEGCSNSATKVFTVYALPTLSITGASGICTGQSATLTVFGASSYSWNTSSTNSIIVVSPTVGTTYSVTGISALGCSNTASQLVTVASSLSISINGPTVTCSGTAVNLSALGGATYTWNTGATSTSISVAALQTTTFGVLGASGTCSNTAIFTLSVVQNPTLSVTGATTICSGNSTTLTVSGADSYTWSNATSSNTVVLSPLAQTVYTVIGTSNLTGCSAVQVVPVNVNALPVITVSGNTTTCLGLGTVLTASGAISYTWSNGSNSNPLSVNPGTSTSYSVAGTDANGCMNASATLTVDVNQNPTLTISSSTTSVCEGSPVTLNANGATSYSWTNISNTKTITVNPTVSTNYTVNGTNAFGCTSSAAIFITVNANPVLAISGSTVICSGESVDLFASGAATYIWNTGSNSSSISVTPSVQTSYSITGTNNQGCVGTSSLVVKVSDCTGIASIAANQTIHLYPNPTNGIFTIELEESSNTFITIRNVVGQLIFSNKADLINQVSLEGFNNGMYYVSVTKNNAVIYSKSLIKN